MNGIRTRNPHRALPQALFLLQRSAVERQSRNGPVLMSPVPVFTTYERPLERVIFWPERDANPFFHFYESMWMLAGRDDVDSMVRFVGDFGKYSDDGSTFHGTYGPRWRRMGFWRGSQGVLDQLEHIARALAQNPEDRRQVLQMWDSCYDVPKAASGGKDVPCNVTATFQVDDDGRLCLVVFCRSNDVILGCYGANAVQFPFLLEYVASWAGLPVGTYTQISVNWHAYRSTYDPLVRLMDEDHLELAMETSCPYEDGTVRAHPLRDASTTMSDWNDALRRYTGRAGRCPVEGRYDDPFFQDVALPLLRAHDTWKELKDEDRYTRTLRALERLPSQNDWRVACSEWIVRRYARWTMKQKGEV